MGIKHLVSTRAGVRLCPRCQEIILVGVSDGLLARVDPYPVDREMEAVAIIIGRQPYVLHQGALIPRGGHRLSGPVLIEHRCGQVLPAKPLPSRDPIRDLLTPPY